MSTTPPLSVREIVVQAAGLAAPDRADFLQRACGGDAELLARIESLLATFDAPEESAPPTIADIRPTADFSPLPRQETGAKIGRYKVLQLIGEGGFGAVYMAEQLHPVRRKVALKIIKLGMDTKQVIARFEAERQALAMMDHPNIARVLDAGATDTGRPYFVMELVKGVPITEYCDTNNLATKPRLELFIQVCRAVQHAHQKGIIHRDIKPSNILVTLADGVPLPKVIDFGIAKATQNPLTEKTLFTEYRQLIGTPEYMSPEQAEMTGIDIDTRSDIYSLGVLLYELLTGTTPFDPKELRSKACGEMQKMIREVEPPKPSTRLQTLGEKLTNIAAHRASDARKLTQLIRGELDWIVMKCLEKDRTRRYETSNGVAADVERYLNDETVTARPATTFYRLHKMVRRHKAGAAATIAIALTLIAGIIGTGIGMVRARAAQQRAQGSQRDAIEQKNLALGLLEDVKNARAQAELNAARALGVSQFLQSILSSANPNDSGGGGRDVRIADLLDLAAAEMDSRFKDQPELEISARTTLGDSYRSLGLYEAAETSLRRAHDLAALAYGPTSERTLDIAAQLSFVLANLIPRPKGMEQSTRFIRETHATAQRVLGDDHQITQNAANSFGLMLDVTRVYGQAEQVFNGLIARTRQAATTRPSLGVGRYLNNLAVVLQHQGRLADAERVQREAIEALRQQTNAPPGFRGRQGRNLATILELQNKFPEALDVYNQTLADQRLRIGEAHPDTQETVNALGVLLIKMDRVDEGRFLVSSSQSLAELTRTVDRSPRDHTVYTIRGTEYASAGRFKEAADDFAKAIALLSQGAANPAEHWNWYLRGTILAHLDDRQAYRNHCQEMLKQFQTSSNPLIADRTAKVCFLLPDAVADLKPAIVLTERALGIGGISENAPWFRLARGMGEYRVGNFDQAIDQLTRARAGLRFPPALGTVDFYLAMIHQRRGDREKALAAFNSGVQQLALLPRSGHANLGINGVENWMICHIAHREAKALLNVPSSPASQP